jgi:ATP-dependent DNA ligase
MPTGDEAKRAKNRPKPAKAATAKKPREGAERPAAKRARPAAGRPSASSGALPAEALAGEFPPIDLPIRPPYPPMEAASAEKLPDGPGWLYEPKWDGFRCLAFRKGKEILLQSKSGQPLGRYFPEVAAALGGLPPRAFALDGEIVIFTGGALDFDALLQRIHPAASRIAKLSRDTPAVFLAFDLLVDGRGKPLVDLPLAERRAGLEAFFAAIPEAGGVLLSPAVGERKIAERWMRELGAGGLDGIVAKRADERYRSGERAGMVKVKRLRTVDCVVGGFRYLQAGGEIGSLLLGLYDDAGKLDHVGFSSSFTAAERRELKPLLAPLVEPPGFTGKAPGGPSRWSTRRSDDWQPVRPVLVCEVRYDHFSGARFRHGTKFLRWRPDKKPELCTVDQVKRRAAGPLLEHLGVG